MSLADDLREVDQALKTYEDASKESDFDLGYADDEYEDPELWEDSHVINPIGDSRYL